MSIDQAKIRIIFPSPDETVKNIMRQLRHGKQRDEKHFQTRPIPIRAEKPILLVPDAAMPENFLDVGQSPERREKNDPIVRNRAIKFIRIFAPRPRIKIDQRKIRNAVNYHVRYGKGVIGIKKNDADIPADRRRRDDNILADIQKTGRKIKIDRFGKISR